MHVYKLLLFRCTASGAGDNFVKGFKAVFIYGKVESRFTAEVGASFANVGEKSIVKKLLSEGKNVTLRAESKIETVTSADFLINGILTELKTVSNVVAKDLSKAIKTY